MDYSGIHRPVRALVPADDGDHPIEAHPFFNESRYIHLVDGAAGVGGWFRIGRRPNQGFAEMTVCLYLPDGQVGFMHAKPSMAAGDGLAAAGLSFQIDAAFQRMRVRYAGPLCLMPDGRAMEDPKAAFKTHPRVNCTIALQLTAVAPAHGGELLEADGRPYDEGEGRYFARAHYDQSLRGSGLITVDGRCHAVNGFGLRDHSWGPRIWQSIPWYRWFPCTFDEGFSICLIMVRKADGEHVETGFVHEDGEMLHVHDIALETDYDAQHYPTGFRLRCSDERGRIYAITGETLNAVPCRHVRSLADGATDTTRIMESMTRYTCNGKVGYGLAEYMDHVADGVFEGVRAGY
ncbi:DUF7064 domain-containing protein [Variovorax ginsengisoli]|uniref:AttH domain-containing protein n=1 Tax=Variovorax ginsengisoli TaxID=363844 RepID=A0ABT9SB70_9BURK|nr:hypothetical protein [Variovorax ginsengisoli]MDP9901006.1 hypothetical protein [Variovorax ginsengisoli]